ncbi:MAG: hypothetical protein LBH70_09805 [Spirochaetaceae bacterium]|jgi:hypothetical protein|nr:hypothetical protein [Spirochaetaceae bacterium]
MSNDVFSASGAQFPSLAEAFYKVGGSVPATHRELTFADPQLGQTPDIALCWENELGGLEPSSPIQAGVAA